MCKISKEDNIVNDYKNGDNISTLECKYGGRRKTIRKILFKNNLIDSIEPIRNNYFRGQGHDEIKKNLLSRYVEEKDLLILRKEYNIPIMSLYNFLIKENVYDSSYGRIIQTNKVRNYKIDENYFDNIDCEEKAYFLGILYADGTNSLKSGETSLRLQEDDYEILKKLNDLLQPTKPIHSILRDERRKTMYRLTMNSKKISCRLSELGVVFNKTFKLTYPIWLDENLDNHFIRGYFDGDGCVTFNKANKYLQISFCGTESLLLGIQNILIDKCGLNKVKMYTRYPKRNNNTRSLMYSGKQNSIKFYNFLYQDSTLYMKRKKDKFDKYLI